MWLAPRPFLSVNRQDLILFVVQASAKVSFVFVMVFVLIQHAVMQGASIADIQFTSSISGNNLAYKINIEYESGIVLILLNAMIILLTAHVVQYYWNAMIDFESSVKSKWVREQLSYKYEVMEQKKSRVVNHVFSGKGYNRRSFFLSRMKIYALCALSIVAVILFAFAAFFTLVEFDIEGITGAFLRELSDSSPNLLHSLAKVPISIIGAGVDIGSSAMRNPFHFVGAYFLQIVYFIIFILLPVIQPLAIVGVMLCPMQMMTARFGLRYVKVLLCWNTLEVTLLVFILVPLLVPWILEAYINSYVSNLLNVEAFCVKIQSIMSNIVSNPERDASCFQIRGSFNLFIIVLAVSYILQAITNFFLVMIADAVIEDRFYVYYSSRKTNINQPKPGKPTKYILKLFSYDKDIRVLPAE